MDNYSKTGNILHGCCNIPEAVNTECCDKIKLPYGMESFTVETKMSANGMFMYFDVTINYRNCYPVEKRYTNIEDFYKEYHIVLT